MEVSDIILRLEGLASHNPKDLAGMARFGINVDKAWVISIPRLRQFAKEMKKEIPPAERHQLALGVWNSGIHEAKILAGFMDYGDMVTDSQMEEWVRDFDSWDVTDMVCTNLFDRTPLAVSKIESWSKREEEFVKRAAFVIMAGLAVHNKEMDDKIFIRFLKIIKEEASDNRNYVRKAVSWALRQIGKSRNRNLYLRSLDLAEKLYQSEDKSERWIGSDAYRELKKDYISIRFS